MLTLRQALQEEEPDHWRVIAQAWDVEYPALARDILAELVAAMLSAERVAAAYHELTPAAREALGALRGAGGKMPVVAFTHRFGEIRPMGPARREREQPWLQPASATELLWYRAWLGRTFLRSGNSTQEFFFLPDDLAALLPAGVSHRESAWRLLAHAPGREEKPYQAGWHAVDDVCTMLAYLRTWPQTLARPVKRWKPEKPIPAHIREAASLPLLITLLIEKGVVSGDPLQPDADLAKGFLEAERETSAGYLLAAWRDSRVWNDLAQMGAFRMEGSWPNDPLQTRSRFLAALRAAPSGEWCTLESLIQSLRESSPEYMRPFSDFESWILCDETGEFLHGLESWDRVEGRLVRYLITNPMAWLGAVDLTPAEQPLAFRLTPSAGVLWEEEKAPATPADWQARVRSDGTVLAPEGMPLLLRYQLARCADWIGRQGGVYLYRITPHSLDIARKQGVRSEHILPLLEKISVRIPSALAGAIRRWEKSGIDVTVRPGRVLVIRKQDVAERISRRIDANRGVAARLEGPVWIVQPSGANKLRTLLVEDGFLLDEEETS